MSHTTRPSEARERILEAADRLFYREGLRAVGIDRVIAEAGVAKMTLYAHFKGKDDLIVAYLRRKCESMRGRFRAAADARRPAYRLMGLFDDLRDWMTGDDFRGCAFINSAVELADPNHPGHGVVADHKRMFAEFVRDLALQAGVRNAEPLARQLAILIDGAIVAALIQGSAAPAQPAADAARALIATAK